MSTRIEIELTSSGADGQWTWRAAGAREPRGTLDATLLPGGAAVGDHVKAESEKDLDGIRIVSIVPDKGKTDRQGLLEMLPSNDKFEPVVEVRATRDRHEGGRGRPRRDRDDRGDRGDRGRHGDPRDRPDRADRPPGGDRRSTSRGGAESGDGGEDRRRQRPHFTPPPETPQRPKPKRLRPSKQHLTEVLASIPEEQRPVAELALQGMPAVRQRIREDNSRLKAQDKPEMPPATVLKMAEELLPRLRVAEWLDRADAAKRQLAHLDLRDLRSVVAAADDPVVMRDEETRVLATELKAALLTKQDEELELWLGDVEAAADVGRVVRALKLSAQPPKAGVPFPAPLGAKLAELANSSMTPEDPPDRWIAVLEAAAFSPVRSLVTPSVAPTVVNDELRATVTRLGPLLPQIAAVFGVDVDASAPAPKPLRQPPRKKEAATPNPSGTIATHPGPKAKRSRGPEPKPATDPSPPPVGGTDDGAGSSPAVESPSDNDGAGSSPAVESPSDNDASTGAEPSDGADSATSSSGDSSSPAESAGPTGAASDTTSGEANASDGVAVETSEVTTFAE